MKYIHNGIPLNWIKSSFFIILDIPGKVYKGILSNGHYVAVKHITDEGYMETFVREVRSLSHVRHPNLVALIRYCENETECFLVYELCHNGNLSEWLFGICFSLYLFKFSYKLLSTEVLEYIITMTGNNKVLSWIQRLKIAIDSARGLEFLHTYPGGCIVHRDIKV